MLSARLVTGAILVFVFVAVLRLDEFLAPWFPLWFLLVLIVLAAASLEIVNLLNATSARPSGNTVFAGVLAIVLANWAPHITHSFYGLEESGEVLAGHDPIAPFQTLAWPFWAFAGVVMVAFVVQSIQFQQPGATMARLSGTVLAITYVGLLSSFVIQFRWLPGPHHGMMPLAMLIATAKGADTGAYTVGRLFGRHKLWPRLSPKKTIEGALGGLVFGVLATLAVMGLNEALLGDVLLSWPAAVGFGVVVGIAAQLGDLMESMIKRDCMTKDASDTLPGYGGVLDVLDSLLFAGPVALGYWLMFGP